MKTIVVAAFLSVVPVFEPCAAQTGIHVFIDPVLISDIDNDYLIKPIKAALSAEPFVLEAKPSNHTLMIMEGGKPSFRKGILDFSVSFFRDGNHLADSNETCELNKVSDCVDQLVSDVKGAAAIGN